MSAIAIDKKARVRRYALLAGTALITVLSVSTTSSSQANPPAQAKNTPLPQQQQPRHHWYQIGRASWYGELFQGHQTASGEDFDMNRLTCAHRSLPLGSLVRVTNLNNHKSVVVRVNDRGPLPGNRVIDLSYAAAQFIGFGGRGTAPVRIELVNASSQLAQVTFPLAGTQ